MANHSSATEREQTPHVSKSTKNVTRSTKKKFAGETPALPVPTCNLNDRSKKIDKKSVPGVVATGYQVTRNTLTLNGRTKTTISKTLRRRAEAVINDKSIDAESRAIIRYGLETNDPLLPELVRRIDAGETIIETIVLLKHSKPIVR